jgi:hypothetical protein
MFAKLTALEMLRNVQILEFNIQGTDSISVHIWRSEHGHLSSNDSKYIHSLETQGPMPLRGVKGHTTTTTTTTTATTTTTRNSDFKN